MRRAAAAAVGAACAVLAVACGGGASERAAAPAGPAPAALPASAVPYLESSERPLTAAAMAKEAGLPELVVHLREWGFQAASRRSFQGPSKRLQVVDSRTLRFGSPAGAAAFVRYVGSRPGDFLGGGQAPRPFASGGRRGILVEGLPCSCHLATPVLLGVVSGGPTVTWLEINGPRATRRALDRLAATAP
jgi:hypothetical protein